MLTWKKIGDAYESEFEFISFYIEHYTSDKTNGVYDKVDLFIFMDIEGYELFNGLRCYSNSVKEAKKKAEEFLTIFLAKTVDLKLRYDSLNSSSLE